MKIISSPFLRPGEVLIVSPDVLRALLQPVPGFGFEADFADTAPVPYDRALVPPGHEPEFLLSDGDWLLWDDRVRLNNDLIRLFGTRRKFEPKKNPIFCGIDWASGPDHSVVWQVPRPEREAT